MSSPAITHPGEQSTDPDVSEATPAQEAMAAVQVGLYVSAARCLLTYVVAPVAGTLGVFLGPIGFVLLLLGAITSAAGARRLWLLRHRARFLYAGIAIAVCALLIVSVVELVDGVLG